MNIYTTAYLSGAHAGIQKAARFVVQLGPIGVDIQKYLTPAQMWSMLGGAAVGGFAGSRMDKDRPNRGGTIGSLLGAGAGYGGARGIEHLLANRPVPDSPMSTGEPAGSPSDAFANKTTGDIVTRAQMEAETAAIDANNALIKAKLNPLEGERNRLIKEFNETLRQLEGE